METTDDFPDAQDRCVYVLSDVDGYKYKLVLQGPLQQLTVRRIKKYLQKAAGLDSAQQLLSFNGQELSDDAAAADAGLFDGAILRLQQKAPDRHPHLSHTTAAAAHRVVEARLDDTHRQQSLGASRDTQARMTPSPLQFGQVQESTALRTAEAGAVLGSAPHSASAPPAPPLSGQPTPQQQRTVLGATADVWTYADPRQLTSSPAAEIGAKDQHNRSGREAYCRDLEAKVAALSVENVRLREQLTVVARQAVEAQADWRLKEEVTRLRAALQATKNGTAEAERAAALRWRAKEEELVRELDLLREERRRLQEEAAQQESKVQELLHSMEGEIRSLKHEGHEKDEALQTARLSLNAALQRCHSAEESRAVSRGGEARNLARAAQLPLTEDIDALAATALSHLSYYLATPQPLQLDPADDTCVVPISPSLNMLVTLDRETERLYLYVTLLDALPSSPVLRLRLYEVLLEGALLGKDMAGGGVGLSTETDLVLMSTSTDLRHNGALALAAAAPAFVESALAWEGVVDELLQN